MSASINRVQLLGNLGDDPRMHTFENGDMVANLRIATTETWKDDSGQKQELTEWHSVSVLGGLAKICKEYLQKGSRVYIEGQNRTRKYTKDGQDRYVTEVRVAGRNGKLIMLGAPGGARKSDGPPGVDGGYRGEQRKPAPRAEPTPEPEFDDGDIPF